MLAVRSLLRANTQVSQIAKNVQKRNMTLIVTPAREKVTNAELFVLSTAMVVGWCAIPAWVLYNIKNYRSLD